MLNHWMDIIESTAFQISAEKFYCIPCFNFIFLYIYLFCIVFANASNFYLQCLKKCMYKRIYLFNIFFFLQHTTHNLKLCTIIWIKATLHKSAHSRTHMRCSKHTDTRTSEIFICTYVTTFFLYIASMITSHIYMNVTWMYLTLYLCMYGLYLICINYDSKICNNILQTIPL